MSVVANFCSTFCQDVVDKRLFCISHDLRIFFKTIFCLKLYLHSFDYLKVILKIIKLALLFKQLIAS